MKMGCRGNYKFSKIPSLIMLTAAIVSLSQLDKDMLRCLFDWK